MTEELNGKNPEVSDRNLEVSDRYPEASGLNPEVSDRNSEAADRNPEVSDRKLIDAEAPVFLMNVADDLNAGMLESMLNEAGIPVLRKYPETGQVMHLVMGTSLYGTDLFVPGDHLDAARELVGALEVPAAGVDSEETIVVRPMDLTDYPAMRALWDATPGVGLRSLDDSEIGISRFLLRNPTTCFVADAAGQLVGSILCGHDGRRGYIYHTTVAESYRGREVGSALVDTALQALLQEGIHKAALVVFRDNALGNPFWEALGWERRDDLHYYNKSLNADNK